MAPPGNSSTSNPVHLLATSPSGVCVCMCMCMYVVVHVSEGVWVPVWFV